MEHQGRCYCGAVTYTAADLSDIWYCHCTQCRKVTGHYVAAGGTMHDKVNIQGELVWHPVSDVSSFGGCAKCGSKLFWKNSTRETISVLSGGLENTKGITVKGHIYVASKGDYYDITDGLPQFEGYPPGGTRS